MRLSFKRIDFKGVNGMWRLVAFSLGGAVLGFGYQALIGCRSGTCPITSSRTLSTLYGAVVGCLAAGGLR